MVTLVVWAYLAPTQGFATYATFTSLSQHAANCVIMFIDFLLAGYRFNPRHFPAILCWCGLYTCWHLIANAAYGMMAYPFFKTDNAMFIGWIVGLALLSVGLFFCYYGVSILKNKCCTPVVHASASDEFRQHAKSDAAVHDQNEPTMV
uniref:Uncharacterized protein n=1 Tax=Mucochytrium quahogii TaxID=96639 RepID=A0A7S2RQN5_9STRA|mmetsp:Transcript_12835/g.23128  ORF Transcript_12835/g.23128 Transcript_12835/m.23128 type:complete len:148 (+) Transcript_12835:597-1040(+)